MSKKLFIWWLSQEDCERVEPMLNNNLIVLPKYIEDEFYSRVGRAGRGRLWITREIDVKGIEWPSTSISKMIEETDCGGIVIYENSIDYVINLPGFITDLNLDLYRGNND